MHCDASTTLNAAVARAKLYIQQGYAFPVACQMAAKEKAISYESLCQEMRDRSAMLRKAKKKFRAILGKDGRMLAAGARE
jgi:hypothetical protein